MSLREFLEMKSISKNYNGTRALRKVDFSARTGEVHAIIGENGAGKSTLVKILTGAVNADEGRICILGKETRIDNPHDAHRLGIRAVHQHFSLISHLSVTENILIGNLPSARLSFCADWNKAHNIASEILDRLGFSDFDVKKRVSDLSVSQKQMVEIAKAVSVSPKILIMDEPSAVLSQKELERLFDVIRRLKDENVLILYISHRLDEIFSISNRVTVLKDGGLVGTVLTSETDKPTLVKMMVGRPIEEIFPDRAPVLHSEALGVRGLSRERSFKDITFSVAKGEILGFYGLVGSGRTEMARCIFGADKMTKGEIYVCGKPFKPKTPRKALNAGVSMLTEDRSHDGLVMFLSIRDNISLASMSKMSKLGVINKRVQHLIVKGMIDKLNIKPENPVKQLRALSGGNQQKVALAKWLALETPILILDEPTRGVDVATKHEIYNFIRMLADSGAAIIVISSELPEVIGLSDRIIVMREGCIAGEFTRHESSEENLLACAAGVTSDKEDK
jgi:ABC-type sugar transport system ATPase subunit